MDVSSDLTIAIIGAGSAGRGFAEACALAGFRVVLEDVMPTRLRHAEARFLELGREVRLVSTVEDAVREADLAVDFVPDGLESKLEIWSLIDRMAPPKTILCTPSEDLSITDLASCTYRADRCVMVRGMLRGVIPGAVQVLTARETSAATQESTVSLFRRLGAKVEATHDPDLPMLLKNMHAARL